MRSIMHDADTVAEALRLHRSGLSAAAIAERIGCPRPTVAGWMRNGPPGATRPGVACPRCMRKHPAAESAAEAYIYLLGLYLGDGCLSSHPRGVHRLRVNLDATYPGIIEECHAAMAAVAPANRVGRQSRGQGGFAGSRNGTSFELSVYATWWPCLLPQHGPGRKHDRPIVLADWQSQLVDRHPGRLLRGLIHSDGCRFVNTGTNWRHARYSFSNRSADIREIFCAACDRLALRWTLAPNTVYVSRSADVNRLDALVGPKR